MQVRYPKSFLMLVVIGFTLVGLPLALALITSALSIDKLSKQSQRAVLQATHFAQGARELADEVDRMERNVRQYAILGDADFLEAYHTAHRDFGKTMAGLRQLSLRPRYRHYLENVGKIEAQINNEVSAYAASIDQLVGALDRYEELGRSMSIVLKESDALIEREVESMSDMAAHSRNIVLKQLWMMMPLALLLIIVFAMMLAKPVRGIEAAIAQLGQGDLRTPIEVDGPQDLRRLGQRLDWLREQLREVEEQKTRFLQQVSHDLKTPLSALREGADLLSDGSLGTLTPTQKEVAGILRQNSIRLQRQIEELLQYGAVQSQARQVKLELVPLKQLTRKVMTGLHMQALNKELDVKLICPRAVTETDAEKLRVIVDNLLSNAIKHAPQQSVVELRLARNDDQLWVEVIDEGPGIPRHERNKIFERFYHRAGPEQGPVPSSGLGLAIVAEFVRALAGSIEICDRAQGAHFRVRLPIAYWADETT
ncbi:two-component system sensor histidine kinase GlrK [Chitinivorax tropicus]|uniref:histidine kinase n=1 Tax=Chitinivorax tropicus TaxID=714531 RepID=A0A840MN77_9PROT|nr:ATP-binding protein [Chitinivorax tropicus]MBB5018202.1 two-component system sensor histidine kinase GlrK [Chitinivorax tropicus]